MNVILHEINVLHRFKIFYFTPSLAPDPVQRDPRNNNDRDNRPRNDTRRMFGSKDATIEQFPYVVSIQKGDQHWCSGALLNPRIVVTTANCVWK